MTKQVEFTPSSRIRHIAIDQLGTIYEVAGMYDQFANDTLDPALAVSCVIALPDGRWWSTTTDDVPIYTVH